MSTRWNCPYTSVGSQNKIPILNRKIRNLMISRSLLSQSIHRLIKHYSILVIIQMSQYFYVLEGENRRLADSHPPIYRYSNCFWQILCFSELINRFWKSSPNLEWTINIVSCFCNISWFSVFRCKKCAHYFQNKQDKGAIWREYINEIEYWICSM